MSKTQLEVLTGKAEAYLKAWLPYVAGRVARALPKGTVTEDGLQAGVICHISDHPAFFRGPKAKRPWVRVLVPSKFQTDRTQTTLGVSIAVETALHCVRALIEGLILACYADENLNLKANRSDVYAKAGILPSGKLDAETKADVAKLVETCGEYPVHGLQALSRNRPKQGNRTFVWIGCPKACSKQADRTKGLTAIGFRVSRFQADWFTATCKACGSEMQVFTSKAEADKAAKNSTVTETAELPHEA